MNIKLENMDM